MKTLTETRIVNAIYVRFPSLFLLISMVHLLSRATIRLEKHLQCEKLLGLARGTTKKRGNKKSDESITPIRYNVNHMYTGSFPMFSQPICHAIFTGGVMTNPYIYLLYIHFRMWGT